MDLKFVSWVCLSVVMVGISVPGVAAVKIGNLTRANKAQAYQQVNETRYQAELANIQASQAQAQAATVQELPISVPNQELAGQIQSGDPQASVSVDVLEKCSKIYPNGEFMWAKPMVGRGAGGATTCVAVVEMRAAQAGPNGEDVVVARANLAAGDMLRCNISDFPESTWLADAANVEFPADAEPTKEDVIAVMNEEQKQHAGLKILAGGLVAAVAGNAMGDNEPGKDGILGTGKSKLKSTAVGALTGAGLMAASSYTGKVGGDMIMSAGVNAAAGALVGNMSGAGDAVLRIEKCVVDNIETTCLYGKVSKVGSSVLSTASGELYVNKNNIKKFLVCDNNTKCEVMMDLMNPTLLNDTGELCGEGKNEQCDLEQWFEKDFGGVDIYCYLKNDNHLEEKAIEKMTANGCGDANDAGPWIQIANAYKRDGSSPAMMVGIEDKPFGWKKLDFDKARQDQYKTNKIVERNSLGGAGDEITLDNTHIFEPMLIEAEDGGLIDINNKARTKSTLVGAGAGAGLGAFTAYQGAQTEIEERLVSAQHDYKASLLKVYCQTGKRFLSKYNDMIQIPNMPE